MEIKRTTEIFIATHRRLVIRQPEATERQACPDCGADMLAAEHLAQVMGLSRRAVYRYIETGAAHFVETQAGVLLVCVPRLAEALASGQPSVVGGQ